jgi:signal transduction histidine kinase
VRITVTDGEQPSITVEDNGIGIAVELRERIFERFFRIDDPAVGPQPGTGLGLYISRELAERHGGSLVLGRSELGRGSVFVLRLPSPAGAERPVSVVAGPAVGAALEQVSTP